MRWNVPIEMGVRESKVAKRLHRVGRFYVFLREIRHELFDKDFEQELEAAYKKARGTEPLPPALLAMVTGTLAKIGREERPNPRLARVA